jgi:hypothetical protein
MTPDTDAIETPKAIAIPFWLAKTLPSLMITSLDCLASSKTDILDIVDSMFTKT